MSKTVEQWQLRATADGWKWNDIEYFWYNDKGERSLYHELEEIYTTPSPDVAGSDAVGMEQAWQDYARSVQEESNGRDIANIWDFTAGWNASRSFQVFENKHSARDIPANTPKEIYLQVDDDGVTPEDFKSLSGVTWSVDRVHDTDVKYVLAAPAFQAAQGESEPVPNTAKNNPLELLVGLVGYGEQDSDNQPAPAAVSAGTWVNVHDRPPKTRKLYFIKSFNKRHGIEDGIFKGTRIYDPADGWDPGIEGRHLSQEVIEWLDESTPGIPDVRELVEALENIVKHHDFATEESTGMSRHLAQIAQTALAGIKRK